MRKQALTCRREIALAARLLAMLRDYEGMLLDGPSATMTDEDLAARPYTNRDARDMMRTLARETGLVEPVGH